MARRQLVKGWDWVKTERVFLPERPKKENDRRASNAEALKTVAITAGVVAGLVGLFWYQRQQAQEQAPEVVYVHAPEPEPVRQLELLDVETPLFEFAVKCAAMRWIERSNGGSVAELFDRVWAEVLPGVVYPGPAHPGDHPSVHAMRSLIWRSIWAAGLEWAEKQSATESASPSPAAATGASDGPSIEAPAAAKPSVAAAPPAAARARPHGARTATLPVPAAVATLGVIEAKPVVQEKVAALTSEWPTPGRFVRLDGELAERGLECVAVRALGSVVVRAVQREGGTPEKAQARVRELMMNTPLCIAYAKMIEQSQWNAASVHELRAGQLVWCPPIQTKPLLDRRRPKLIPDPRPWSDGSPRIEPPPTIWA